MVAIHTSCNRWLEVSVRWPHRAPLFYVDGRARMTCPTCKGFLTFATLRPPRSLNDMTNEELKVWFDEIEPTPFEN